MHQVEKHIEFFKETLGVSYVLTDANDLQTFGRDWTTLFDACPTAVLLPANTDEVSRLLKYCHEHSLPVVPSGGRTGLAGGAVASQGEYVLSLSRMNKILSINTKAMYISVEAGVTTQMVQEEAARNGVFFALDLAAKGSSQIGGNISTNAGGLKLIRYGGMREQVLGLEVVLADGRVLDLNTPLRKNNTGYDLKHLFIGAEGTLGVITRATLKLMPQPRFFQSAILGVASVPHIMEIMSLSGQHGLQISAYEFFTDAAHKIVCQMHPQKRPLFTEAYPYYVLLEIENHQEDRSAFESFLGEVLEKGFAKDAVIAMSSREFKELWGYRELITESLASYGHVYKNDISVAVGELPAFLDDISPIMQEEGKNDITFILFGHVGDGNIHINYIAPKKGGSYKDFVIKAKAAEQRIFKVLQSYRGSVSAEHGIGLIKTADLKYSRTAEEIAIMQSIRRIFDPKDILNPGKIFKL